MTCCKGVIVEGVSYREDYGLGFCWGTCSEVWKGKPRLAVASNQTKLIVSAIFSVSMSVGKWLLPGYLLKVAAKCAILWNQKLWCCALFLHKNKRKQIILQVFSLKHSIKKSMFSVVGKMNLFRSNLPILLPLITRLSYLDINKMTYWNLANYCV